MGEETIVDQLDESMQLSDEAKATFAADYELRLTPEAVFVLKEALSHAANENVTAEAEETASVLLSDFRQQTTDTNTAELTGAEWYHIYGSVFTLAFSDHDVSADQITDTSEEIKRQLPEIIQEIMDKVGTEMTEFLNEHDEYA